MEEEAYMGLGGNTRNPPIGAESREGDQTQDRSRKKPNWRRAGNQEEGKVYNAASRHLVRFD
jgi:hypothetical protein